MINYSIFYQITFNISYIINEILIYKILYQKNKEFTVIRT